MGHDKEIKRVGLADFCKGLKASQGILIVLKILRKLVPHEENSGDVVLVNDAFDPIAHGRNIQTQGRNAIVLGNLQDIAHHFRNSGLVLGVLQHRDDLIHMLAAEIPHVLIFLNQAVKVDSVCLFVFQPAQGGFLQGCFTTIGNAMLLQRSCDAIL